jgi:hypothetical protein
VATAPVSERLVVTNAPLRILTVTVRAARRDATSRRWALAARSSTASRTATTSERSVSKVVSALTCLASPRSVNGRSSIPRARRCRPVPMVTPSSAVTSAGSSAASAPTVVTPARCRDVSATGPIPHSARTGSGSSSARSVPCGTMWTPSGLASSEAILAICLPEPAPTETASPVRSRTSARMRWASAATSSGPAPASTAGSANVSSKPICSSTGACSRTTP